MDFYLIHSIKGGCGKTTIALRTASQLAMRDDRKICLLDVDFKGTGLSHLLLGDAYGDAYAGVEEKESFIYWNQCFSDPAVEFAEQMLIDVKDEKNVGGSNEARLQIAVSDPKQVERDKFIGSTSPTDGLAVNIGIFRFKLLEVIKKLEDWGYTDVVLDLPPSFDEYTKGIFQEFFSKDSRDGAFLRKLGKRVILYLVTSYDRSHFLSTKDFLVDYAKRPRHRHKPADHLRIIFNDVSNAAKSYAPEDISGLFDSVFSELSLSSTKHLIKFDWKQEMAEQCSIFQDKAKKVNLITLHATDGTHEADGVSTVYEDLIVKPDETPDTERME